MAHPLICQAQILKIQVMQKGSIGVKTENIFPVIKKFLYSDNEIFLREIISNAVDATQKLKTYAASGDFSGELGDLTVEVKIEKGKLIVSDKGIGMTADEVDKYINQIAFSSAEEFVKQFKTKSESEANSIIGHFGLGFYSAFMVSKKVEIITKSFKEETDKAVKWVCDGSPEYEMSETKKQTRGTDIILHIDDESKTFLEEYRVRELLNKYCKFLPVPIQFGTKKVDEPIEGETDKDGNPKTKQVEKPWIVNDVEPLWKKSPSNITEDEYKDFYHALYPMNFDTPLFQIHLNVDYPFNLTGILYFPKIKNNYEFQRNKIQLYCNQVFVTDSVEGILPEFLTLLHGVIDSPDIPLNVSRSFLQNDQSVKKISGYITKKVAEKLEDLYKKDRDAFISKWDDIKVFIQYGMISDPKFYERAEKFFLFKDTEGKYYTIDEYKAHIEPTQVDKDKKLVYLYSSNVDEQYSNIETAKERGYNVLIMDGILDSHFINALEQHLKDCSFARVDSNTIENLIKKDDSVNISKLDDKQKDTLKESFEKTIDKTRFRIVFENMSETDEPLQITQDEWMRRMKDMNALGGNPMFGQLPDSYNLVVNANNPIIYDLLGKTEDEQEKVIRQIYDLALLSKNLLKGKDLNDFIKRNLKSI